MRSSRLLACYARRRHDRLFSSSGGVLKVVAEAKSDSGAADETITMIHMYMYIHVCDVTRTFPPT